MNKSFYTSTKHNFFFKWDGYPCRSMPLKQKYHRLSGKCNLSPTDYFCYSYALLLSLSVLKQAIIRDLNTDLQAPRVTSVPPVLKCSDAVLQLEHLTASWQKQKPTHRMVKEGGYRMAGACWVPKPVSNDRLGVRPFHPPCRIQPHGPSPRTIFLPSACNTRFSAPFTSRVRDVAHRPQCQLCPFSASWLKLGATAGTGLPRGLLAPSRMVVRPLRHQACPWPWSQAKLQGQPASLGFMLHPACGPITATLIRQASKSCTGIIQRKKRC